jgi:hypothetical protein
MTAEPVTVEHPKHRMSQLATFELRDYRKQLERAITFFDKQDPVPPARDQLQAMLDLVIAEQESRRRFANGGS